MSRKKKGVTIAVFAFMQSPHGLLVVTKTGKKVLRQEFESQEAAKEHLLTDGFLQMARHATEGVEPLVLWVDDPAGSDECMAACAKMEALKNGVEMGEGVSLEGDTTVDSCDSEQLTTEEPKELDSFEQIKGVVEEIESKELDQIEVPLPKIPEITTEEVVEVEVEETHSESKLKGMLIDLENLKAEAAGVQADYNKQIKDSMKEIFSYAHGKARTHVQCRIEYDWETGLRSWFRKDNGEFVKSGEIPYEMRQLNSGILDLVEVGPVQDQGENPEQAEGNSDIVEQTEGSIQDSLDTLNQAIAEGSENITEDFNEIDGIVNVTEKISDSLDSENEQEGTDGQNEENPFNMQESF